MYLVAIQYYSGYESHKSKIHFVKINPSQTMNECVFSESTLISSINDTRDLELKRSSEGYFIISFTAFPSTYTQNLYQLTSNNNGQSWYLSSVVSSDSGTTIYNNEILFDQTGKIHLFYVKGNKTYHRVASITNGLMYSYGQEKVLLDKSSDSIDTDLLPDGTLALVLSFRAGNGNKYIYYYNYIAENQTWVNKHSFTDHHHDLNDISIYSSKSGKVTIAYKKSTLLYKKVCTDNNWSNPTYMFQYGDIQDYALLKDYKDVDDPIYAFRRKTNMDQYKHRIIGTINFPMNVQNLETNVSYKLKMYAKNSIGEIKTKEGIFTTLSDVPSLTLISKTQNEISIRDQNNAIEKSKYKFFVDGKYVDANGVVTSSNDGSNYSVEDMFTVKGLSAGQQCQITAIAYNKEDKPTEKNQVLNVITQSNIIVDRFSSTTVDKSLSFEFEAHDYKYSLSTSPYRVKLFNGEESVQQSNWLSVNDYTFSNLKPNTAYKAILEVKNENGDVIESSLETKTSAQIPILSADDVSVTNDSITLNVSDSNSYQTLYKIYANEQYINVFGESSNGSEQWYKIVPNDSDERKFVVRNLVPNTDYTFKIVAQNQDGVITEFSDDFTIKTKETGPKEIIETVNGVTSVDSITLSWKSVEHATGYVVKVGDKTVEVEEPNVVLKTGLIDGLDIIPDTAYKVSVAAKNSISTTEFSLPTSFKTLKAKPVAAVLSISSVTNHSIGLSWNEISGVNKYELEVDGHLVDMNLDNNYVHKDLDKKSQHTYRIRCYNSDQMSDWSPVVVSMTTENDVRTELQSGVVAMTNNSVTISWNEVSNATAYYVQVNDGPIHKNGAYPYAVIGGLSPSTAYTFKVYAGDASTYKATPIVSITESTYALETPIIKRIPDEASFKVKWETVDGATGYNVYLSTSETPILVTNTEYLITLEDSVPLSNISVQAVNGDKLSGKSNVITILPRESVPTTPDKLGFISGEDYVLVTWDDVHSSNDNIYYDIEVDGVIIEPLDRNKYYHDGLDSFTEHKYRIRSKSSMVNGLWSSFLEAITLPSKPLPPKDVVIKNGRTTATLSWQSIPSAKGYDIKVNEDDQRIYSIGSQSEFIHRGIPLNQEQSYRIRTHNIIGESEWGNLIVNNSLRAICKREEILDLGLTASNIDDFSKYTLQVTYNPDVLEVVDICGYTSDIELDTGLISGEDIEVIRFEDVLIDGIKTGIITFKVNKPVEEGYSWSGIVNNIKFKPRLSGATYLTYTVMIEE